MGLTGFKLVRALAKDRLRFPSVDLGPEENRPGPLRFNFFEIISTRIRKSGELWESLEKSRKIK
jgi:hypothetical protein